MYPVWSFGLEQDLFQEWKKNAAVKKEKAAPQEVHRRVTSAIKEMQLHSPAPVRCCY